MLATPIGTMEGSYQMVTDTGESFEAPIRAFSLARPGMLH
jgi:ApaG protein